jgi:hypothetical protein
MIPKCIKIPWGAAKGRKKAAKGRQGSQMGAKGVPKATKMEPKGCQNGVKNDAKPHQKTV